MGKWFVRSPCATTGSFFRQRLLTKRSVVRFLHWRWSPWHEYHPRCAVRHHSSVATRRLHSSFTRTSRNHNWKVIFVSFLYILKTFFLPSSRKNPFSFIVVPDAGGNALGELFWDDGVSLGSYSYFTQKTFFIEEFSTVDTIENDKYGLVTVFMMTRNLQSQIIHWTTDDIPLVSTVKILGVTSATEVKVDGQVVDFTFDVNNQVNPVRNLKYQVLIFFSQQVLIANLPEIPLNRKFELNWQ